MPNKSYGRFIETSTEKVKDLEALPFNAGQYLIVIRGEEKGYTYYDSVFTGQRELISTKSEDIKHNWDKPTTVTVGGLKEGSVIENKSTDEILYEITHPFIKPTLSMSCDEKQGVFELGVTTKYINKVSIKASGSSEDVFVEDRTLSLLINNVEVDPSEYIFEIIDTDNCSFTFNTPKDITNKTTVTFKIEMHNEIISANNNFEFVNAIYYGTSVIEDMDFVNEYQIKNGTKVLSTKSNLSYKFTGDNMNSFVAYDKDWGDLKSIIDQNKFEITSSYIKKYITINEKQYVVYVSEYPSTVNNFGITFNF